MLACTRPLFGLQFTFRLQKQFLDFRELVRGPEIPYSRSFFGARISRGLARLYFRDFKDYEKGKKSLKFCKNIVFIFALLLHRENREWARAGAWHEAVVDRREWATPSCRSIISLNKTHIKYDYIYSRTSLPGRRTT